MNTIRLALVLPFALHLGANLPFASAAAAIPSVGLKQVAEGFVSPLNLLPYPDVSGRLLIGDQVGTVHILARDGQLSGALFLDLRERLIPLNQGFDERGLLGLALHPKFSENRRLFVFYSAPLRAGAPAGWNCTSRLSEFKVNDAASPGVDLASEKVLLEIDKPQMNHNCGRLAFGPDGYLYVGVGDGGGANDNEMGHGDFGNGQNVNVLLGKILRLDVDHGAPYRAPSDNPFVQNGKGRAEIYAYGLRNPWGISFDQAGQHELFAADVGQNAFEELDIIVTGGNYGWRMREGFHCFDTNQPNNAPAECPKVGALGEPLMDPILEYKNFGAHRKDPEAQGISITGGYVYRGKALPQLLGRYVFGDWSRSWALPDGGLFAATRPVDPASKRWTLEKLTVIPPGEGKWKVYVTAFGQDAEGELYVLTSGRNAIIGNTGKVFKLTPARPEAPQNLKLNASTP